MTYIKLSNDVVVQKQPYPEPGFIQAPDSVVCGMVWRDGDYAPPPPGPAVAPQSVTPAQGLMALYVLKGITEDDVLAAISRIEDPAMRYQAHIAYRKATTWDRDSITMQTVGQLLALTEKEKSELFAIAATYTNL